MEQSQGKDEKYQNQAVLIKTVLYVLLLCIKVTVVSVVHAADLLIVELEKWLQLRGAISAEDLSLVLSTHKGQLRTVHDSLPSGI